jgi:hypothetical protein
VGLDLLEVINIELHLMKVDDELEIVLIDEIGLLYSLEIDELEVLTLFPELLFIMLDEVEVEV